MSKQSLSCVVSDHRPEFNQSGENIISRNKCAALCAASPKNLVFTSEFAGMLVSHRPLFG